MKPSSPNENVATAALTDEPAIKGNRFSIKLFIVAFLLTGSVLAWLTWSTYDLYTRDTIIKDQTWRVGELRKQITHLDEVLTMSARMAAATGDPQWERRYRVFEPKLDEAIKEILKLTGSQVVAETDAANIKLVEMETQAFTLVRDGHTPKAYAILSSGDYETQKRIYADGMSKFFVQLESQLNTAHQSERQRAVFSAGAGIVVLAILLFGGLAVIRGMYKTHAVLLSSIAQRRDAEDVLRKAHDELEVRVKERTTDLTTANSTLVQQIAERRQVEVSLRESEERYRLLFENNPYPMWVFDSETLSFSAINEAAAHHYGYSREEFLSMTVNDICPPEHVPALRENLLKPGGGVDEAVVWRHRKKDGSLIDVEITSHELLFAGRRAELVLANDITERRRLEAQLRQAQKLESIGQLAAGIAHEINTPTQYVGDNLRFIQEADKGRTAVMEKYSELLKAAELGPVAEPVLAEMRSVIKSADVGYMSVEVPKALKQSLEGVALIAKIVQSMKDFAHPGSTEKKAIDLNRAIESTVNVACSEWKYVAEMELDFDLNLPPVPCLLGELNQVTLNMIINSSHAIADKMKLEGQEKGLIKISTRHEGDWAVMRIRDTGRGIPQANRARVFDPFFTTKEVGKGTGQGLAISHTVVQKHGGTIDFETVEGEGTTFIVRLPLHEIARTPDGLMKEAA